jgi:hypothetical protein
MHGAVNGKVHPLHIFLTRVQGCAKRKAPEG